MDSILKEKTYSLFFEGLAQLDDVSLHVIHTTPRNQNLGRVLFLGGSNFDLRIKKSFLRSSILSQYEFVTYEPRGIHRSSLPDGKWSMADFASDAKKLLDWLSWDSAVVIGESFGGMTALHLASDFPDVVRALVVSSATAGGEGGSSLDLLSAVALSPSEFSELMLVQQDSRLKSLKIEEPIAFSKRLAQRIEDDRRFLSVSGSSGGYERLLKARQRHDIWDRLTTIKCPTIVIAGCFDLQAPPLYQEAMASQITLAEFHCFEEGHGVLFASSQAQEFLMNWLHSLELSDNKPVAKQCDCAMGGHEIKRP